MSVAKGLRPPLEEVPLGTLRTLMEKCWDDESEKRPIFRKIRKILSSEYKKRRVSVEKQLHTIALNKTKLGKCGVILMGSNEFVIHYDICVVRCSSLALLLHTS